MSVPLRKSGWLLWSIYAEPWISPNISINEIEKIYRFLFSMLFKKIKHLSKRTNYFKHTLILFSFVRFEYSLRDSIIFVYNGTSHQTVDGLAREKHANLRNVSIYLVGCWWPSVFLVFI